MKNLISCAPYAWSYDRYCKTLINADRTNYNIEYWKYEPGNPCHSLVCGFINHLVHGAGKMIAGEYGYGSEYSDRSACGLVLNFMGSKMKEITIRETSHSNRVSVRNGSRLLAIVFLWTITFELGSIADAFKKTLVYHLDWSGLNSKSYHMKITPHFPPLILSELNAEEAGLFRKIIFKLDRT